MSWPLRSGRRKVHSSSVKYWRQLFWLLPLSFVVPLAVLASTIRKLNFGRDDPLEMAAVVVNLAVGAAELLFLALALLGARFGLQGRRWTAALLFGAISLVQVSPLVWMGPDNRNTELALVIPGVVAAILALFWVPWASRA